MTTKADALRQKIEAQKIEFEKARERKRLAAETYGASHSIKKATDYNAPIAGDDSRWTSAVYREIKCSPKHTRLYQLTKAFIYAIKSEQATASEILQSIDKITNDWNHGTRKDISELLSATFELTQAQIDNPKLFKRLGVLRGVLLKTVQSNTNKCDSFYMATLAWIRHNPDKYTALPFDLIKLATQANLNRTHQRKMDQTMTNQPDFVSQIFNAYAKASRNDYLSKRSFEKCQAIVRWCYERASKPPKLNVAVLRNLALNDVIKTSMTKRGDMERFMTGRTNNASQVAGNIFDELFG